MTFPAFPQTGGCLCGAVRYRLTAPPRAVYACHCKDCQRAASGPYAIGVIAFRKDFEVERGGDALHRFDKPAESGRTVPQVSCPVCGTRVWHDPVTDPSIIILRAGTLDDAHWAQPVAHIWTARKLPWAMISPDVLSFPGALPSRDVLYAAWEQRQDR